MQNYYYRITDPVRLNFICVKFTFKVKIEKPCHVTKYFRLCAVLKLVILVHVYLKQKKASYFILSSLTSGSSFVKVPKILYLRNITSLHLCKKINTSRLKIKVLTTLPFYFFNFWFPRGKSKSKRAQRERY